MSLLSIYLIIKFIVWMFRAIIWMVIAAAVVLGAFLVVAVVIGAVLNAMVTGWREAS
jgi:predicted secreted protein